MNHYSSWKYILILLTIGLSLLYVTPNFYGESFAVQVMPVKAGEAVDRSTLKLVEASLDCLLYTSPRPRDRTRSRMPSSA